jgi:hypothetical protein
MNYGRYVAVKSTLRGPKSADRTQLCAERDAYRTMYAKAWTDTSKQGKEIDVILCPPSFGAACPHERSRYWGYTCQYRRGPTDAFYERSD